MSRDFLVVDFEFTHYTRPVGRPRGFFSEIIEIGAVKIDGATMGTVGQLQHFVKPHFYPNQAKEAMDFCMITEQDMKTAIAFDGMLAKLGALYVPGETYFVSWGDADWLVVDEGCRRHGRPNPVLAEDCLDLALAYRLRRGDTMTTGLRKAAEELDVAGGLWHTAYDDAVNTGKILERMLANRWTPEEYFDAVEERRARGSVQGG